MHVARTNCSVKQPGLAAWLYYQQPPAPGYLITMGWMTRQMKDFIRRLKWATKIIHLISASIVYYSLDPPNSTTPRTIEYHPPCIPLRSHFHSYPYPIASASDMVGCCVLWLIGGWLNHGEFWFILLFAPDTSMVEKLQQLFPPLSLPCVPADFWLVVAFPHPEEAIQTDGTVALSIFFIAQFNSPKWQVNVKDSPTHSAHSHLFSNASITAEAIVWLVVALTHRIAATQAPCPILSVVGCQWH